MPASPTVVTVGAVALTGIEGTKVEVETALSSQLPGIRLIGLPDIALGEAKQRIRLAAQSSGLKLASRMIVINLSPAALRKQGSSFDLAIALGALAASGHIQSDELSDVAHIGELGLDGTLRRPKGLFTSVLAALECGYHTVMVPSGSVREALLVPNLRVIGVSSLAEAVAWHNTSRTHKHSPIDAENRLYVVDRAIQSEDHRTGAEHVTRTEPEKHLADISDVIGQDEAVEALVVAAAGRHNVSISGPPGSGKSMLASRLRTILPKLTDHESVTATRISALDDDQIDTLVTSPPFEEPHHTASLASIIGGVVGVNIHPGAVTRSTHGVLFLDEAPEFSKHILESLRQPLETRIIHIQRARAQVTLPANFQLVLASNPCQCGYGAKTHVSHICQCTPTEKIRYARRISGPLRDRIDVRCEVNRVSHLHARVSGSGRGESSTIIQARVSEARLAMRERLKATPWSVNAEVPGVVLRSAHLRLSRGVTAVLDNALARGSITLRGYDRVLRIAWTIADLNGRTVPMRDDVAFALSLRGENSCT